MHIVKVKKPKRRKLAPGERAQLVKVRKALAALASVDIDRVEDNGVADILDLRLGDAAHAVQLCEEILAYELEGD